MIKQKRSLLLFPVLLFLLGALSFIKPAISSPPGVGGDFELIDHNGNIFNLQQERGKLVLIFFGYTSCPDVCPMELFNISNLLDQLGEDSKRIKALFITVDPKRDTAAVLKRYVSFFNPELLGLTGTEKQIKEVTSQYHVQNSIVPNGAGSNQYTVNHSSNLYLLNTKGRLINIIPFGIPVAQILHIVKFELSRPDF